MVTFENKFADDPSIDEANYTVQVKIICDTCESVRYFTLVRVVFRLSEPSM